MWVRFQSPAPIYGQVPERPKGTDCKSVVTDFGGSNPPLSTKYTRYALRVGYIYMLRDGRTAEWLARTSSLSRRIVRKREIRFSFVALRIRRKLKQQIKKRNKKKGAFAVRFHAQNAHTDRVNPLSVIIVNLLLRKVNRFADKRRKNTPDLRIIRKSGAEIR